MDPRPLLLVLAALLAGAQGEGACPVPAPVPSLLHTVEEVLKEVPGAECRRQVAVVLEGIRNLNAWALHMADATAKVPSGLLRGNLRALGDMDECVAVEAHVRNTSLHGKYCLASWHVDSDSAPVARLLDIATAGRRSLEFRHRHGDLGNGEIVESPGLLPELSRGEWGVCVPAACSAADVEAALRALGRRLLPSTGLRLDVRVPPLACRTRAGPARPLRAPHYAFAIIIAVLVMLSVIGTLWDSYCKDQDADASRVYRVVLRAFSLRVGWKRLTSERKEEVGCIAGIRALTSIYLMLTHEIIFRQQEPSINKVRLLELGTKIYYTPFVAGPVIVDTFFTISATLYSYYLADSIINGKFSYIMTIVHRFIRLSPIYYLLLLFYTSFLEYLGDGPHWPNVNYNVQSCRQSWIWNVFYLSNYANNMNLCMAPSWYLSADIQLVIVAPLAVLPLFRWRRGRQLMLALIALATAATAATVVILRIPSLYSYYNTDRQILLFLINVHTRTHMHASSYLVGLSLGYILHNIKNKDINLNKGFLVLGWALCISMVLASCVGPNYMVQASYKYSLLDSAAYPAIGRLFWAIAVSWIIFTCHTGYGGLLNNLLDCYALRVISRLSYIANLTQFLVLLHSGGHRRIPLWLDELTWIQLFFSDYMMSMIISFVLFVLVDSPVNLITRSFFFEGPSKKMNGSPKSHGSLENKNK